MTEFSKRLAQLRREKGETLDDVGRVIGRSGSAARGYEYEDNEPSFENLCKLAEHYEVTTDYLLGRSDSRSSDDTVFINDSNSFSAAYQGLPANLRHEVASAMDAIYVLLSRDMKLQREEQLSIFAALFSRLEKGRGDTRAHIGSGRLTSDDLADILKDQQSLKGDVSELLDKLLQADMDAAPGSKKDARSAYTEKSAG